jgi:transcriptional regulator with XRE-family HTH domain
MELSSRFLVVAFHKRIAALRKERGLTQQAVADDVGVHVTMLRRYEAGTAQPTLDVLKKLARALRVSADVLIFDADERGPGDDFRLYFEALAKLDEKEKAVVREVLEALLLKHDARRWATP